MPYQKKYKRRKRTYRKRRYKKKSKSARLKDSKINTLEERAALRIVKKDNQKKAQYFTTRGQWLRVGALNTWGDHDSVVLLADCETLTPLNIHSREIAKVGGYLENQLNDAGLIPTFSSTDMSIYVKNITTEFYFHNPNMTPTWVDMILVRVPYDKHWLANNANVPDPLTNAQPQFTDHHPFTPFNSISSDTRKMFKDGRGRVNTRAQVLARGRLKLMPGRMIDDIGNAAGSRVNLVDFKRIKLRKTYKNLGRQEPYSIETFLGPLAPSLGSLSKARYFFSIRVTNRILCKGVSVVKFCRGRNVPKAFIFDVAAPAAS